MTNGTKFAGPRPWLARDWAARVSGGGTTAMRGIQIPIKASGLGPVALLCTRTQLCRNCGVTVGVQLPLAHCLCTLLAVLTTFCLLMVV